ncbi:MAG: tyrosine-type recombinase/integrase [Pseudonocardiaceae bacterium]
MTELAAPLDAVLAELSAGQVTAFLVRQSGLRSTWYAKAMVTALRSLLRFLHTAGHMPHPLVGAVPSVPGRKVTTVPRSVNADELATVLAGCDRDSAGGRRDYAILLLARLGLRAGEVSAIELDDINWRAGELMVRGKGNRIEVLPLPVDVGEALADYVQYGRPRCAIDKLFVILCAPSPAWHPRLRLRGGPARRYRPVRTPPAVSCAGLRSAPAWRFAGRDRPGAAAQRRTHDRDLRQSHVAPGLPGVPPHSASALARSAPLTSSTCSGPEVSATPALRQLTQPHRGPVHRAAPLLSRRHGPHHRWQPDNAPL